MLALASLPASAQPPASGLGASFGAHDVARIPAGPGLAPMPRTSPLRPLPVRAGRNRCIAIAGMAGAAVIGDRAVELTMTGGRRWRMMFAQECPALSFYQGFYYRRAQTGTLCAGRDAIIARSGGECAIASIIALKPLPRRH